MNNKPHTKSSQIITSLIDIPSTNFNLSDLLNKINVLPVNEIEIEPDTIELIEKYGLNDNIMTTVVINYPLGGYQVDYIFESIRWASQKKIDVVCTSLPLFWLRSNETIKIKNLIKEIISACGEKTLRISLDSDLLSREEVTTVCDFIYDAGIYHLKASCGFSHNISVDDILYIKKEYPDLLLTVDNDLKGDSIEIDNLLQLGVNFICVKEPWLYHF